MAFRFVKSFNIGGGFRFVFSKRIGGKKRGSRKSKGSIWSIFLIPILLYYWMFLGVYKLIKLSVKGVKKFITWIKSKKAATATIEQN